MNIKNIKENSDIAKSKIVSLDNGCLSYLDFSDILNTILSEAIQTDDMPVRAYSYIHDSLNSCVESGDFTILDSTGTAYTDLDFSAIGRIKLSKKNMSGYPLGEWLDLIAKPEYMVYMYKKEYPDDFAILKLSNKTDIVCGAENYSQYNVAVREASGKIENGKEYLFYVLFIPTIPTFPAETDPTVPAHVKSIQATDITNWNKAYNSIPKIRGRFLTKWGTSGSGDGQLNFPQGMVSINNYFYVADTGNNRVQEFDFNGNYTGKFGTTGSGNGQLNSPNDVAVNAGSFFVVDKNNHRIQVFSFGFYLRKWGTLGSGDGQFNSPEGITIYNNEVFVVDNNNNRIQVFDLNGVYLRKWTDNFINGGIAVYDNEVFVTSPSDVRIYDLNGVYLRKWGRDGSGDGQIGGVSDIIVQNNEAILLDFSNDRIQVFI